MAASLGSYDLGQHSCSLCSGKATLRPAPELVTLRSQLELLISSEELWPLIWPTKHRSPRQRGQQGSPTP